jgi:hypothetical protein
MRNRRGAKFKGLKQDGGVPAELGIVFGDEGKSIEVFSSSELLGFDYGSQQN